MFLVRDVHNAEDQIVIESRDPMIGMDETRQAVHVEGSAAHQVIEVERDDLWAGLPNPAQLFAWCLKRKQEELLRLLAYCVAQSIDAIRTKTPHSDERIYLPTYRRIIALLIAERLSRIFDS